MRQQLGGRHIPNNLSARYVQSQMLGLRRWRRPTFSSMTPPLRRSRTDFAENFTFGHLHAEPNEGILFFDHIFPIKLQWLLRTPWHAERSLSQLMKRFNSPGVAAADPANMIKRSMPPDLSLTVTEIVPRLKDGGAFVKFTYPEGSSIESIEKSLHQYLREHPIKPWFSPFRRMRAYLVRGRPWLEDLYRLPSSRLKVEFVPGSPSGSAVELSQEALYSLFRRYGKLADIKPQPADSKVLPRYAILDFARLRPAIVARNCMHGFRVTEEAGGGSTGTALRLTYEQKIKAHWIRDWLFNHPRLVIPALAVIITTITVAVFDPIRTFFVKAHIEESLHITHSRIYRWFAHRTTNLFAFHRHHRDADAAGLRALWDDRKENIQQIRTWLMETAGTFIVVQGPRGSAKRELVVDEALKDRKDKLVIDCKPIQEARGDSATIRATAAEVGYRPVFSWTNSFSSLLDLAAQGTIGTKTGFSETLDSQLAKILQTTATALKQVALADRKKDDKDAALGDDEYLEAHPEQRPVVVLDNFLHKNQEGSVVYDKIAEWAAGLTVSNIAHVIFLTHDVSFSKSLSKALPDRVFRQISLGDCSPEVAKRLVLQHLDADETGTQDDKRAPSQRRDDLGELDGCIETLGGRLTDLEFLARRIKVGESPSRAVQHIVEQSASEILKMYLLDPDRSQRPWTPEQAWLLIKQLSENESLRYSEVLLSSIYKSNGEPILRSLEQAELITIHSVHGRPHSIRPGRPVYSSAFRLLVNDRVLASRLDLTTLKELLKQENGDIEKVESELALLAKLPGSSQSGGIVERVHWLTKKLQSSQRLVERLENDAAGLKKVLKTEY